MNEAYNKILYKYKDDTLFIKNFSVCENAWIQFRDAQMKMKFPENGNYGSMFPLCWYSYKEALTVERITVLKEWIDGFSEHGCDGSVQ